MYKMTNRAEDILRPVYVCFTDFVHYITRTSQIYNRHGKMLKNCVEYSKQIYFLSINKHDAVKKPELLKAENRLFLIYSEKSQGCG